MGLRRNQRIDPNEVVTAEEAAERLNRSVATVWRRAARGELHPTRFFGRTVFSVREVEGLGARLSSRRRSTPTEKRRPGQGTAPRGGGDADADTTT